MYKLVILVCSFFALTFTCSAQENVVVLVSFSGLDSDFLRPDPDNYWYQLKLACEEAGYELTTKSKQNPEDVVAVVAFNATNLSVLKRYPKAKTILYTWEPPIIFPSNFSSSVHDNFTIVATWDDDLVDGKKYQKFNYALLFAPQKDPVPFEEKKLCCAFIGNKHSTNPNELYSHRLETIRFFEENAPNEFNFFGPGWSSQYKTYLGFAKDKVETAKQYKFAIVYENTNNIKGYITEKIFDIFSAGCVPVYWGASNIADYIPTDCFIAREQFPSNQELYEFLRAMPEERYNEYLQAISSFLQSEQAALFSREQYIKTFIRYLQIATKE